MESKKASHILPLIILTVAGFTFNTSELIPIGLLTDIASDFGVSEAARVFSSPSTPGWWR